MTIYVAVLADKRGVHTELAADISAVLRKLQAVVRFKRWTLAALFYERMVSSQKILSESQVLHYQQILSLYPFFRTWAIAWFEHNRYLDVLDSVSSDIRHGLGEFAHNLLSFLQTHTVDPDSALIGLPPADDVIHRLSENSDFTDSCKLSKDELVKRILPIPPLHPPTLFVTLQFSKCNRLSA